MAEVVAKPWYASRTLWINSILAGTTVLAANLQVLQPLIGPAFYVASICVVASVNAFLRLLTTQPIAGVEVLGTIKL